jgi:hypothetical protein
MQREDCGNLRAAETRGAQNEDQIWQRQQTATVAVTLVPGKIAPQQRGVKAKDQEFLKTIIPTHTSIRSHRLRRLVS